MKMKVAEPIQTLEYLRDSGVFPFSTVDGVLYTVESIDVVIDTMRRYKKIEQIVDEKGMPEWSYQRFMEIASIVRGYENGNDD
jgi:hypothetical protein